MMKKPLCNNRSLTENFYSENQRTVYIKFLEVRVCKCGLIANMQVKYGCFNIIKVILVAYLTDLMFYSLIKSNLHADLR